MISPSIGRIVWFWPAKEPHEPKVEQPNAAIVAYVWHDRMVNLTVFDSNGNSRGETSVVLLQDDDLPNEYGRFASWMPYQKGQAAKAEALEKQIKATP